MATVIFPESRPCDQMAFAGLAFDQTGIAGADCENYQIPTSIEGAVNMQKYKHQNRPFSARIIRIWV